MQSRSKRVAAIHDLSGFGRSSLTVVIPVFAKMGIQACPLPTALLSTHGAYKGGTFLDLTDQMVPIMEHWSNIDAEFDAIYSGFLGSADQVDIVIDFIDKFTIENQLVVVDPVMGDNGKVYSIIDSNISSKMGQLVAKADIITPNTTEAFVLLGKEYTPILSEDESKIILKELSDLGPEIVILTSIHSKDKVGRYTGVYNKKTNEYFFDSCEYIPRDYPGTGDAFTSVLIGALLKGCSLKKALSISLRFIEDALKATIGSKVDPRDGINLESPEIIF